MLYDTLANLNQYTGLFPNLDKAIDCIEAVSYTHLTLKAAACAAARVRCTRPWAGAQGFENIEPCKTAAGAVLLRPLHGVMV